MKSAEPTVGIVVVAAGSGARLGLDVPKAFAPLGDATVLERSLRAVFSLSEPAQVVVVAPAGGLAEARTILNRVAGAVGEYASVVAGGATRQASVAIGIGILRESLTEILVHDAARPLTPVSQFERVLAAVRAESVGVVPGLPMADTVKSVDQTGAVLGTVDRSTLCAVQTPQGFPAQMLREAYSVAQAELTDDAAVVQQAGNPIKMVAGDPLAFKVTTAWDLNRANQLLGAESAWPAASNVRVGFGVDAHAFDPSRPLHLAGLFWPNEPGLAGHSDADAVCHAICDALLSGAGLGDIGSRFGVDDSALAGAAGEEFLRRTLTLMAEAGFRPLNVAVQLIGNRPRFSARRREAESFLSGVLGAPVTVSATTTDGMGFTGRGEGVAALATALVRSGT